jgi:hypothetical protein
VPGTLRLAVAQTTVPDDPSDVGALRESGAQYSRSAPAGIVAPGGRWIARCPANGQPAITVADLDPGLDPDIDGAIRFARPWRRVACSGLYDAHHAPDDPRSRNRTTF